MWRQFLVLGGTLLLIGGLLFVAGIGGQDSVPLGLGLPLFGSVLAGIGAMFFQAGLIGAAIGADWRSIQKGEDPLLRARGKDALVCAQCGDTGNRVGNLYCRTCGAQLSLS